MRSRTILAIVAVTIAAAFPAWTTAAALLRLLGSPRQGSTADAVITWNANAGQAAIAACIAPTGNPLHESRMYAMMHVAIHDALNAIDRRSQPYAFRGGTNRPVSPNAAVATAARDVLVPLLSELPDPFPQECIDAGVASVEADYAAALDAIPDGAAKSRGMRKGARQPRPSSRSEPRTGQTLRCWTPRILRAPIPASTGSRPEPRSPSLPAGAT